MFFIGGFNSFIPYLLYLSLIWVFIIIGFGGKINQVLHMLAPKEHHASNEILQVSDVCNYDTYHAVIEIQDLPDVTVVGNGYNDPAAACSTTIIPGIVPDFIPPDRYTPFLRGPPAIIS